ncbi:MAG: AAA family ATPase [Janthinobacterium lividum]
MLPPPPAVSGLTLRVAQNACYEALSLALKEGQVFAALTGPERCGKTVVLDAVMADRKDRALRFIRIADPDKVPASLADQIEQVAYAEAGKPENLERHVVLAIDDAHTASDELLQCLSRLASMREPGRRIPQILLVGRPELWNRLAVDDYEPLARRLAIRATLPAAEDDSDPWASVESDVTQTMAQLRAEAELMPVVRDTPDSIHEHRMHFEPEYGFGTRPTGHHGDDITHEDEIPPPSMFALFADPPLKAGRSAARDTRRRLVTPLVSLFVGLAAFAFALSFYDWPDLLGDMPWADSKPGTLSTLPRSPQSPSFGLSQPASKTAPAPSVATTAPPTPAQAVVAAPPARTPSPPAATMTAAPPSTEAPAKVIDQPVIAAKPAVPEPGSAPIVAEVGTPPVLTRPRPLTTMETALAPTVVSLLLKRGDEEFAIGDISAARLFYERAAEANSALAARQMARTFDSAFLPAAVDAALADAAKARQWYQRAASLGNPEAAARLKALAQGR